MASPNPDETTQTSYSGTVVVAGDICLDVLGLPIPAATSVDGAPLPNWRQTGEVRTFYRRGGALLLADFIRSALNPTEFVEPTCRELASGNLERLTRNEIVQSLLRLKTFEDEDNGKDGCKCTVRRIRIEQTHGCSGPTAAIDPSLSVSLSGDSDTPDLLILDDTGNRFREDDGMWPAALKNETESDTVVIYKLHRPLPTTSDSPSKNKLWERVKNKYESQTVVVVDLEDLRAAGADVSRRLSWERTATDLVWQLNGSVGTELLAELRSCRHLVIRIGLEGLVYWQNDGTIPQAWLLYDPKIIEGDWNSQHAGTMVGYGSAFVAGLASVLTESPAVELTPDRELLENSVLCTGLKRGLAAARYLLTHGYGTPQKEQDPTPDYPVGSLPIDFQESSKESYALTSIPISQSLSESNPSGWSILDQLLPGSSILDEVAAAVAREKKPLKNAGIGRHLAKIPRGEFGNLVTYDRNEIEAFRAISNLVREYLNQLTPKRPLCLAVFGPPGSGKSFGVEEVAKGISKRTKARIVKLTFNLSQFSADGDDLSRALHLVRDVVLRGDVPLVFFDEFDSSVGETKKYWLKKLLAPMQDGEFLDQGVIHPLGRAIFVFAGGTSHSYEKFVPPEPDPASEDDSEWKEYVSAKGPDFVSRLRGVLNIPGIEFDPAQNRAAAMLRRASVLRFQLLDKARHLFDSHQKLRIDDGVLRAFLNVERFRHGIRSLEAILDMSQLAGRTGFDPGALPHPAQMSLHVECEQLPNKPNHRGFLDLVHRPSPFQIERRELIAKEIHDHYLEERDLDNSRNMEKASHQTWDNLNDFYRDSNRTQADDIPRKLKLMGYGYLPEERVDKRYEQFTELDSGDVEKQAEREHKRWCSEKRSLGWTTGAQDDSQLKTHPSLVDWRELDESEKEKDRAAIKAIPRYLKAGKYVVVRTR